MRLLHARPPHHHYHLLLAVALSLALSWPIVEAQQDYVLDRHPSRVVSNSVPLHVQRHVPAHLPAHLLHLYDTKCHNGIVGLFCEGTGCYYNSDCFDGHCNMYSKCEIKLRNAHITEMEQQMQQLSSNNANAVQGLASNQTASQNTTLAMTTPIETLVTPAVTAPTPVSAAAAVPPPVIIPLPAKQKLISNSTEVPPLAPVAAPQPQPRPIEQAPQPMAPSQKNLQEEHFKESPFSNADQLNTFLMWFGIISAVLISAFIIQCCREIARSDETPLAVTQNENKANTSHLDDPLNRASNLDHRSLLSDTQFKNQVYYKHMKQKQMQHHRLRTPQQLQHQQDTELLISKFNSHNSNTFRSGQPRNDHQFNSLQGNIFNDRNDREPIDTMKAWRARPESQSIYV